MNLLKETIEVLKEHNKTPKDIIWCGSEEWGWFSWDDFKELADKEYDDGYGAAEVAQDLLVVGKDFWLERHEYDGSEWWEFKTMPSKPQKYNKPKVIVGDEFMWETLKEINSNNNNG